jgi:hypothetical protein
MVRELNLSISLLDLVQTGVLRDLEGVVVGSHEVLVVLPESPLSVQCSGKLMNRMGSGYGQIAPCKLKARGDIRVVGLRVNHGRVLPTTII